MPRLLFLFRYYHDRVCARCAHATHTLYVFVVIFGCGLLAFCGMHMLRALLHVYQCLLPLSLRALINQMFLFLHAGMNDDGNLFRAAHLRAS